MDFDLPKIMKTAVETAFLKRGNAKVLIAGRTGVGKSTLVNTALRVTLAACVCFTSLTRVHAQGGGAARRILRALGTVVAENPGKVAGVVAISYLTADNYVSKDLQNGEFLYSLQFNLDPDASAVYWSRWFGRPNLTALVQVEGMGEYWVPQVYPSYKGGLIVWGFVSAKIPAGRKINVIVFDDKSDENAVLNALMRSKMRPSLEGKVTVAGLVRVSLRGESSLQILSENSPDLPLVSMNPICTYAVTCPDPWFNFSNKWSTEGPISDSSNKSIGQITFKQLGGRQP